LHPLAEKSPVQLTEAAAEHLLEAAESSLLRVALERLPQGLSIFDAEDRLRLANRRFAELWDLPPDLLQPGTSFQEIVAHVAGHETDASRIDRNSPEARTDAVRTEWRTLDGRIIAVTSQRLAGGEHVALHEDVTAQRLADARAAELAWRDGLTQLPNRRRLRELLAQNLALPGPQGEFALLVLDLDRFKPINEAYGQSVGDAILLEVARRLRHCVRESDWVARVGGDEFAIMQLGVSQPAGSTALARRLIEVLTEPYRVGRHIAHIGVSVGAAIAPFDGDDPEKLQQRATLALQQAKTEGRGTLRYFEPVMDADAQKRRELEIDLSNALERGEFKLVYQPQIDIDDGRITGFEALLRWQHPVRGLVPPLDFIPFAEDTGLIVPIGRWVLAEACRAASQWTVPLRVAVNVSAVQFRQGNLFEDVMNALEAAQLPPERLEVEITESAMLHDSEHAVAVLTALRSRGVKVAMDDFGTGFSSLSTLNAFPFDRIKIDRAFVNDVTKSFKATSIVTTIASLGRSLGMVTTAEGVEEEHQLQALRASGCHEGQGWLFSRPVPGPEVNTLLAKQPVSLCVRV
jgi:diguanylate cyclase (GGDEF)-like protein